jgi:hypothetical protein
MPIVVADPESPLAIAFRDIAAKVATRPNQTEDVDCKSTPPLESLLRKIKAA